MNDLERLSKNFELLTKQKVVKVYMLNSIIITHQTIGYSNNI
jgi:hypothetical protein